MQQNHQGIEKKSVEDPAPRDTKTKEVASKLMQSCAQLTQMVPAYSGAQSCCHPLINKSKLYYHTTLNERKANQWYLT